MMNYRSKWYKLERYANLEVSHLQVPLSSDVLLNVGGSMDSMEASCVCLSLIMTVSGRRAAADESTCSSIHTWTFMSGYYLHIYARRRQEVFVTCSGFHVGVCPVSSTLVPMRPHLKLSLHLRLRLTHISTPLRLPVPACFEAPTAAASVCDAALQLHRAGRPHPVETMRQKIFQPIRAQMQTPTRHDKFSSPPQKVCQF